MRRHILAFVAVTGVACGGARAKTVDKSAAANPNAGVDRSGEENVGTSPSVTFYPPDAGPSTIPSAAAKPGSAADAGTDKRCFYDPNNGTSLDSNKLSDQLSIVIGPDGKSHGRVPAVPETADITVFVWRPKSANRYAINVSGCTAPTQGDVYGGKSSAAPTDKSDAVEFVRQEYHLGRCSGGVDITVQVSPTIHCSSNSTENTVFQTEKVYWLGLAAGASYFNTTAPVIGVDPGIGGEPNRAFERESTIGFRTTTVVQVFPFGFVPAQPLDFSSGWTMLRRVFVGTSLPVDDLKSSLNMVIGVEPVSGLELHIGVEACAQQRHLGVGIKHGDIFADDSSRLPTVTSFDCEGRFFFGAGGTLELLRKLL